jgi:hypothetical protein
MFLVAGQSMKASDGGEARLSPEIKHHLVMASDSSEAYDFLRGLKPDVRILGSSTLADHQEAISRIESALRGDDGEIDVHFSPTIANSLARVGSMG